MNRNWKKKVPEITIFPDWKNLIDWLLLFISEKEKYEKY